MIPEPSMLKKGAYANKSMRCNFKNNTNQISMKFRTSQTKFLVVAQMNLSVTLQVPCETTSYLFQYALTILLLK